MLISGTTYNDRTPSSLAELLNRLRESHSRVRIYYGDAQTGTAWGDILTGTISRSCGPIKIPILLCNRRSRGGEGLLEYCIVKIEHSNRNQGGIIYQHPNYHTRNSTPSHTNSPTS